MKPYPQNGLDAEMRVYNYRHSRARRISENLFGIFAHRFRIFQKVIELHPKIVQTLTLAALTLHNYLRNSSSRGTYCPTGLADYEMENGDVVLGTWRSENTAFLNLQVQSTGHNSRVSAKTVRNNFKEYFVNEGAVMWQWEHCV